MAFYIEGRECYALACQGAGGSAQEFLTDAAERSHRQTSQLKYMNCRSMQQVRLRSMCYASPVFVRVKTLVRRDQICIEGIVLRPRSSIHDVADCHIALVDSAVVSGA